MLLQVDAQRSQQWSSVIEASVQVLQQQLALHPETGLLADFLVYNKSEKRYKPAMGTLATTPAGWSDALVLICSHVHGVPCLQSLQSWWTCTLDCLSQTHPL